MFEDTRVKLHIGIWQNAENLCKFKLDWKVGYEKENEPEVVSQDEELARKLQLLKEGATVFPKSLVSAMTTILQ